MRVHIKGKINEIFRNLMNITFSIIWCHRYVYVLWMVVKRQIAVFFSLLPLPAWYGLRLSVLGQDQSETKKSVLVLVLQVWCCVVETRSCYARRHNDLEGTATFQILVIVSLFCAWNITTAEINSGVHLLKS